jgi:hypothetical protein
MVKAASIRIPFADPRLSEIRLPTLLQDVSSVRGHIFGGRRRRAEKGHLLARLSATLYSASSFSKQPVTKMVKKEGVLALFDVDGTLTDPRKVRPEAEKSDAMLHCSCPKLWCLYILVCGAPFVIPSSSSRSKLLIICIIFRLQALRRLTS